MFNEAAIDAIVNDLTGIGMFDRTSRGYKNVQSILEDGDRLALRRLVKAAIRQGALDAEQLLPKGAG